MRWYPTKDLVSVPPGAIVVARDRDGQGRKEFGVVADHAALSRVIDAEKCVYEQVVDLWRELYDFDGFDFDEDDQMVIDDFLQARAQFSDEQVYIKSASSSAKISLHFIIPTSLFTRTQMQQRFQQMMSRLKYASYYDASIYTKNRLIRTVRSDKCFEGRPFRSLTLQDKKWKPVKLLKEEESNYFVTPSAACSRSLSSKIVKPELATTFKWGTEIRPCVFRLDRQRPAVCIICNRTHDSDNAWINTQTLTVGCFRADQLELNKPVQASLDADRLIVSRSRLFSSLRDFALSDDEIHTILSRARYF